MTLEYKEHKMKEHNKKYLDTLFSSSNFKPFFSLLDYEVYCLSVEKEIIGLAMEERFENQFEN
jgi:hypothetical protein